MMPTTDKKDNGLMATALTLTRNDKPRKNTRTAVYDIAGRRTSVSLPKSLFEGGNAPDTLELNSAVAFAEAAVAKVAESKEDRKARFAAMPKLTLAEKIERREKQIVAMKAKLAASNPQ